MPVPAFPPDALQQLKQRNGERKLAVAATLAKLEAATNHFILTPIVGAKRAAEEVNQPTKEAIPLTLRDFQVSHTPAAPLRQ